MPKYRVEMCAEMMPVWADVEVEAENEEEAKQLARDKAANLSAADWDTSDATVMDIRPDHAYLMSEAKR